MKAKKNLNSKRTTLIMIVLILMTISISFVYSSSFTVGIRRFNNPYHFFYKQLFWWIVALIVMYVASNVDYKLYEKYSLYLFILGILLLIAVLFLGREINGSKRWLALFGFSFQPAELAKIFFLIYFSKILSDFKTKNKKDWEILFPSIVYIGIYSFFIFLEKDLGTIIILSSAALFMLYFSNIKKRYFGLLIFMATFLGSLSVIFSKHRISRVIAYLDGFKKLGIGGGYQVKQSIIGIGNGGLFGLGFGNGLQKYFYLPELHTDFIFSVIAEEGGFIVGVLLILLFFVLMYIGFKMAIDVKDYYAKYLIGGIFSMIIIQTILNLSVSTGLIPVTGRTLPFISFGGTSIVMLLFALGIVLNATKGDNKV